MMHDQHLKPVLPPPASEAQLRRIATVMPDPGVISKAMSSALRKRMGLSERLSFEELRDRRRGAADVHAKRKAKRKRQRASARRNR